MQTCTPEQTRFAELLRAYYLGRITNFEFEEAFESLPWKDPVLHEVFYKGPWCSYDDHYESKFNEEKKLTLEDRKTVARWILFLKSGQSYRWPFEKHLPGWLILTTLASGLPIAWTTWHWECVFTGFFLLGAVGLIQDRHEYKKFLLLEGDHSLWPFRDRESFEKALQQPPYLCGRSIS